MQFLARHVYENAPGLVVADGVADGLEVRGTKTGPGASTDQVHEPFALNFSKFCRIQSVFPAATTAGVVDWHSYSLVSYNDTQIVANIMVASGTPTEDVDVSVTNNGYGGLGFQSGGGVVSPTSAPVYATVHAPINSPEVSVIAWVNGAAPDLNPLPTGLLKGKRMMSMSSMNSFRRRVRSMSWTVDTSMLNASTASRCVPRSL